MAATSGSGFLSSRALVAMIMPGVQKPHWMAPARTKASWIKWGFSGVPRPSTVMTSAPSSFTTFVMQERTDLPLTMTVQAPHCPFRSQDCLVPVRCRSPRRRSIRTISRACFDLSPYAVYRQRDFLHFASSVCLKRVSTLLTRRNESPGDAP